jgi:replicative DNA helicase
VSDQLQKDAFCNPSHERAVLSYCFRAISNYHVIASKLSSKDFLNSDHQTLWVLFGQLVKRRISQLDVALVVGEADTQGVLGSLGGIKYIQSIANMELGDDNLRFYVDKVLDSSTKYQLYSRLNVNLQSIYNDAKNEDRLAIDMIGSATSEIMSISMQSKAVGEAINLGDHVDAYIEARKTQAIEISGLSTGFPILDKRIDGLPPGTLTVFCARPKNGKSTFLSTVGKHVALFSRKPVLYVDTEMSFEEWMPRIISMISGVPERRIKHGGYSEQEYYNIQQAQKLIKQGKFFHEYMPGYSIDRLMALYKKYKYVENIELAVFDYIKAPPGANFSNKKEHQLLGDVTTALKDLAGELQVPVLCANQINRQDDVADSDRILRYADVLIFFKKKKKEDIDKVGLAGGTYKLIVTDSRRGGTTTEDGIGFEFRKTNLQMWEAEAQVVDYENREYQEEEDIEYNRKALLDEDGDDADTVFDRS